MDMQAGISPTVGGQAINAKVGINPRVEGSFD